MEQTNPSEPSYPGLAWAWACILGPVAVSSVTSVKPLIALAALVPVAGLLTWLRSHRQTVWSGLGGHPLTPWCGLWLVASVFGGAVGLARGNDLVLLTGQLLPALTFAAAFVAAGPLLAQLGPVRWPLTLAALGVVLGLPGIIHEASWVFGFVDAELVRFLDPSALVCVTALVLVVGLVLRERPGLGLAVALALAVLVLLTFTRSYWLGAVVAILLLIATQAVARLGPGATRRPTRRRALAIAGTMGLIAVAAVGVANVTGAAGLVADRLEGPAEGAMDSSRVVRVFELKAAWEQVRRHPVAGLGAGGEYATLSQDGSDLIVYGRSNFIHNAYLYLPLKFGLVGFMAALALLFGLGWAVARGFRVAYRSGAVWDATHAATFAGLCAASVTAPILVDPVYAGMAGAIARMAATDAPRMTRPRRSHARTVGLGAAAVLLGGGTAIALAVRGDMTPVDATKAPLLELAAAQAASDGPRVTGREVAAAGSATPSGALLRLWQLVQSGAAEREIRALFAPSARVDETQLKRQLRPVRYLFNSAKPYVVDEQRDGDVARVLTLISTDGLKTGRADPGDPYSFRMARTADRWRLADNAFVEAKYRAELAARPGGQP
ncbi:MAG TPA: O-antigen ligase family protein [Solirubrobacteraceae bacterium]|nr:O-antigen ligase family protein [Solirubrobacteraceae bacterium]